LVFLILNNFIITQIIITKLNIFAKLNNKIVVLSIDERVNSYIKDIKKRKIDDVINTTIMFLADCHNRITAKIKNPNENKTENMIIIVGAVENPLIFSVEARTDNIYYTNNGNGFIFHK